MLKLLAAIVLVPLSLALCCATCVSSLLPVVPQKPAVEVAPGAPIAAPQVLDYHPRGSFSRIGGGWHPPHDGWAEVHRRAEEAATAVATAAAARPAPPVVVVNVEVQQPRHLLGRRGTYYRRGPAPGPAQPFRRPGTIAQLFNHSTTVPGRHPAAPEPPRRAPR